MTVCCSNDCLFPILQIKTSFCPAIISNKSNLFIVKETNPTSVPSRNTKPSLKWFLIMAGSVSRCTSVFLLLDNVTKLIFIINRDIIFLIINLNVFNLKSQYIIIMEYQISQYDNTDYENGHNLVEMDKKIKKEVEKKTKPSVKPKDVFVGWNEKKKVKNTKTKKKGLSSLNFEKRKDAYTKY